MAGQARSCTSNKRWLLRSVILLVSCVSMSQQFAINVTNWDPVKGMKKGLTDVAQFTLNTKDKIAEIAHDTSPPVLGPLANTLDPEWVLHMNYTRYLTDMEEAIASGNIEIWSETMSSIFDLRWVKRGLFMSFNSKFNCFGCKFVVQLIRTMFKAGKSNEEVATKVAQVCTILHIQTARVCSGIINLVGIEAIYVIRQSNMNPGQLCNFFLGEGCLSGDDPRHTWKVNFPSTPKPLVHPVVPPKENVPRLKVLHISDTHYDPHYLVGANADCGEPLCCRAIDGPPASSAAAAGKWGDYRKCDSPKWLLQNAFQQIINTHKDIDYVIWTGDIPPHDTWNQTREGNLQILKDTIEMVATYFKGIPVFPTVGNHESCPVDSYPPPFAPESKNMSWLYNTLDKEWSRWLPSEASETIKRGGFYSVLARPGLRIISMNGNYCSRFNFWLVLNSTDPLGQLAWLIDELQAAENNGEKVHIIGHIPPGGLDCNKIWSKNYYDIINRYEGTVMAQFYGHTHYDEFEVFYDTKDLKRPLNVGYIAPSITTWENVNPSYRIYYVDGDHINSSRSIIDYETWKMDLDEANLNDNPVWYKSYSARSTYDMPSLLPKDWNDLIYRMNKDESLFDKYHRNYYRDSPGRPKCNADCQKKLLCQMKSGRSYDTVNLCRDL